MKQSSRQHEVSSLLLCTVKKGENWFCTSNFILGWCWWPKHQVVASVKVFERYVFLTGREFISLLPGKS